MGTLAVSVPSPLRFERDVRAVVHFDQAVAERTVGGDGEFGDGARDRAQVAAGIFHDVLRAQPAREMIGDLDVLDARQIDHVELVGLRFHAGGFDVIFDRLGQARRTGIRRQCRCAAPSALLPTWRCWRISRTGGLGALQR